MGELLTPTHLVILCLVGIPVLALHFLPAIIAGVRKAKNFWWIFLIDFFLAWTLIGWIVALIWALRDEPERAVGYVSPSPYNR